MKEWVISALEHSGLSQSELARELTKNHGWADNRSILNKIVTGDRELKADELYDISRATGYPIPGEGSVEATVPLMGYIGAGAEIMPDFEQVPPEGLDQINVPFPMPADMIAFEVRGISMLPVYKEGAVVICFREQKKPIESFYGEDAAVRTSDGRRFLKTIMRGDPGVNLISWNAPPIEAVALEWVGEIFAVLPKRTLKAVSKTGGIQGRLKIA